MKQRRHGVLCKRFSVVSSALITICLLACSPLASEEVASRELRLVFFSDVHARTELETPLALKVAANAINDVRADLVIGGGDLITGGFQSGAAAVQERWDAYMAFHNALDGEVHAVIGNHDLVGAMPEDGTEPSPDPRSEFRNRLGVERPYYSFEINGYHVILLDSIQVIGQHTKYQGFISREQMKWLEQDLDKVARDQPIIIATHLPLVTSLFMLTEGPTAAAPPSRVVVNSLDLLNTFRDHNLVLVLQGHLHVSESITWQDTVYITGGAISGGWWRGDFEGTEPGFTVVTLRDDNVEWEYQTYAWTARRSSGP